jgi:hypothetical protein
MVTKLKNEFINVKFKDNSFKNVNINVTKLIIINPIKDISQLFQFKKLNHIIDNMNINKTIEHYNNLIILSNY